MTWCDVFWGTLYSFTVSINTHFAGIAWLWAKDSNLAGHGQGFGAFFEPVFTARRYYRSFAKKGIDQFLLNHLTTQLFDDV